MAKQKPTKTLAVLGRCQRTGRWRVGARSSVLTLLGDCRLDMRASFVDGEATALKMAVTVFLGSAIIILPEGAEVRPSGLSLLSVSLVDVPENPEPSGLPTLEIEWNCVLGRLYVVTGSALERVQAEHAEARANRLWGRRRRTPALAAGPDAAPALLARTGDDTADMVDADGLVTTHPGPKPTWMGPDPSAAPPSAAVSAPAPAVVSEPLAAPPEPEPVAAPPEPELAAAAAVTEPAPAVPADLVEGVGDPVPSAQDAAAEVPDAVEAAAEPEAAGEPAAAAEVMDTASDEVVFDEVAAADDRPEATGASEAADDVPVANAWASHDWGDGPADEPVTAADAGDGAATAAPADEPGGPAVAEAWRTHDWGDGPADEPAATAEAGAPAPAAPADEPGVPAVAEAWRTHDWGDGPADEPAVTAEAGAPSVAAVADEPGVPAVAEAWRTHDWGDGTGADEEDGAEVGTAASGTVGS